MEIKQVKIEGLRRADYNPRKKSEHILSTIRQSLREYDWLQPVVINQHQCERCGDRRNIIVGGHRRLEAAQAEGRNEAPAVFVNLHLEDEKRANLRLNSQEPFDQRTLADLITELHGLDAAKTATLGFDSNEIVRLLFEARYTGSKLSGILAEKFLIPPFSVFDTKQGAWQKRKAQWREVIGNFGETREGVLSKGEGNILMRGINFGSSFFDPVLAEVIYLWFMPEKGVILDPFAGEQTKAFVASAMGHDYHGIEIRPDQVEANKKALAEAGLTANFYLGDSQNLNQLVPQDLKADLIFTSPPYYDLEIYSEQKGDISTKQTYKEFMDGYRRIFSQVAEHLKENRFIVLKLGDIRNEHGIYRNFIPDNIVIMQELGFGLYNEIIMVQMLATAPHRAERNMRKRKVVKTHQNILTFYRGDPSLLKNPRLLEIHEKVLTFYKGDPEQIQKDFKNPPPIERDIISALYESDQDQP